MTFDTIFEDEAIIVCYKPAGVATETKRSGQKDMVSLLRNYRAQKGEDSYIGMVHRLDQPVEGLLVFGKTPEATAHLSRQVQQRSIGKHYYAVGQAEDEVREEEEILTDYIWFDKKNNCSQIVGKEHPQAKRAVLDYRILGQAKGRVALDITLHTGRHHQIRLQMAHHGLPLLGDAKYGRTRRDSDNGPGEKAEVKTQLALCSYRLQFLHPAGGRGVEYTICPRNPVFEEFL